MFHTFHEMIAAAIAHILDEPWGRIASSGKFTPYSLTFPNPEQDTCCDEFKLLIRAGYQTAQERVLEVGAGFENSDKYHVNYLFYASKAELERFLRRQGTPAQIEKLLRQLSSDYQRSDD